MGDSGLEFAIWKFLRFGFCDLELIPPTVVDGNWGVT
jgi:hypothetical protein